MKESSTYSLRLPKPLKDEVARVAKKDGTSINQFIALAVAEKLAVLETASFFERHKARADTNAFRKILNREGGLRRRPGDEIPS